MNKSDFVERAKGAVETAVVSLVVDIYAKGYVSQMDAAKGRLFGTLLTLRRVADSGSREQQLFEQWLNCYMRNCHGYGWERKAA